MLRSRYAADELQSDKDLIMRELVGSGDRAYGILGMIDRELRHARDIINVAVKEHGHCLKFASDELKDDEDVVLVAVRTRCRLHISRGFVSRTPCFALLQAQSIARGVCRNRWSKTATPYVTLPNGSALAAEASAWCGSLCTKATSLS